MAPTISTPVEDTVHNLLRRRLLQQQLPAQLRLQHRRHHREMYTDTATPPYASTAPNAVKIIAASSLRFRRRTRQWIMRRIAQTFAQARFGFSIQRAMSSASFRSTTRLESFDSSDSRLRCGRQRDPDARTQGRFQGVVSHFFIVPGDRCMITSCG